MLKEKKKNGSELKQIREQILLIRKEEISPSVSRQHLDKVLAWHLQAKEQKVNWRKLEQQFLSDTIIQPKKEKLLFKDGSKLLRHWQGKTYMVITQGNQFLYEGKLYKSLSRVAREITGTNWNGKLFFRVSPEGASLLAKRLDSLTQQSRVKVGGTNG